MIDLEITPVWRGGRDGYVYDVRGPGVELRASRDPFTEGARALQRAGHGDEEFRLVDVSRHPPLARMAGSVAWAAGRRVGDAPSGRPKFMKFYEEKDEENA